MLHRQYLHHAPADMKPREEHNTTSAMPKMYNQSQENIKQILNEGHSTKWPVIFKKSRLQRQRLVKCPDWKRLRK